MGPRGEASSPLFRHDEKVCQQQAFHTAIILRLYASAVNKQMLCDIFGFNYKASFPAAIALSHAACAFAQSP